MLGGTVLLKSEEPGPSFNCETSKVELKVESHCLNMCLLAVHTKSSVVVQFSLVHPH